MAQVKFWLILGLLLLGLAACAPVSGQDALPAETATPTPSPTATATIVWFPPTLTPTPFPTRAVTPTAVPQLGIDRLVFSDDFSDRAAWTTFRTTTGSAAYGNAEFTLAVAAERGYLTSLRKSPELADFYLEVTASPSLCRASDSYGLLLRASDDWNYYRWVITCDGRTRLERVRNGAIVLVQDWVDSLQIPPGAPSDLSLAVWMYGPEMRFFIGDIEQFAARDPVWTAGRLGAFARAAADTPLTVSFSDLSVYALEPSAIPTTTPVPTPILN